MTPVSQVMLLGLALATFAVRVECQLAEPIDEEDMTEQQKQDKAERAEAAKVIAAADLTDYGFWPGVFINLGKGIKNVFVSIGSMIGNLLNNLFGPILSIFGGGSSNSFRGEQTIEVAKKEDSATDSLVDNAIGVLGDYSQNQWSKPASKDEDIVDADLELIDKPLKVLEEVNPEDFAKGMTDMKSEWDKAVGDFAGDMTDMLSPGAIQQAMGTSRYDMAGEGDDDDDDDDSLIQIKDGSKSPHRSLKVGSKSPHRQSKRRKGALTLTALIQDSA